MCNVAAQLRLFQWATYGRCRYCTSFHHILVHLYVSKFNLTSTVYKLVHNFVSGAVEANLNVRDFLAVLETHWLPWVDFLLFDWVTLSFIHFPFPFLISLNKYIHTLTFSSLRSWSIRCVIAFVIEIMM